MIPVKHVSVKIQHLLSGCLILILHQACLNNEVGEDKPRGPNIILILADDQGWGDLSFNGNANLQTPHIDAIAKNGISFQNFYVQPVCSPTRAEILTGRYFPRTGVYSTSEGGERINSDETTIADILRKAGYQTAAYGKWHNGVQPPYHPNARGFDDYYGFASGHWGDYFSPILEHNGRMVQGRGFLADDITDKALDFITRWKYEPFFLFLPFNTPHSPMQVPDPFWERFRDKDLPQQYEGVEKEDINFTRAALAMVENIDYNVGRLTGRLQELGLEENTILIYLSDNGPNGWRWNGGMRGKKGSTDEGGVRTPFFVQWKGSIQPGSSAKQIASAIDILPTVLNLAGLRPDLKKKLDGKDLTPLIFQSGSDWQNRLVYNHWEGKTSIRSEKYRLDAQQRLYDLTTDPSQQRDLGDQYPALRDSLIQAGEKWLADVAAVPGDPGRSYPLGHPDFEFTQLPARDGIPHGNIIRSNKFPNCSYFTQWLAISDFMSWELDVLQAGDFEVELYYTCAEKDLGAIVELALGDSHIVAKIDKANDPPLRGMEHDRYPRSESYVKDFVPMKLGTIRLKKGTGRLTLKALTIPGREAAEVRLILFKRINKV